MYDNPNTPRTDLYGIGKGLAQVIDLTPMRENAKLAEAQAERKHREQEHQDAKIQAQIAQEVEGLGDKIWVEKDADYFGKKQEDIKNYIQNNIDLAKTNPTKFHLELNDKVNKFKAEAAMSNQQMKDWYATARQAEMSAPQNGLAGGYNNYDPDSANQFFGYTATQRNGIEPLPQLTKSINPDWYFANKAKENVTTTGMDERLKETPYERVVAQAQEADTNPILHNAINRKVKALGEGELNSLAIHGGYDAKGNPVKKQILTNDPEKLKDTAHYAPATPSNYILATKGEELQYRKKSPNPEHSASFYGNTESGKKVNIVPLKDNEGEVIGFDPQTIGGTDTKEFASVPINGVTKKVRVERADGNDVIVLIPKDEETIKTWYKESKDWKNAKLNQEQELIKMSTGANPQIDKAEVDKQMTDWYKANPYPPYPKDAVKEKRLTGQEAESAFYQAYGVSLKDAYKGKFPKHARVDVSNTQESNKSVSSQSETPKKKKLY